MVSAPWCVASARSFGHSVSVLRMSPLWPVDQSRPWSVCRTLGVRPVGAQEAASRFTAMRLSSVLPCGGGVWAWFIPRLVGVRRGTLGVPAGKCSTLPRPLPVHAVRLSVRWCGRQIVCGPWCACSSACALGSARPLRVWGGHVVGWGTLGVPRPVVLTDKEGS